MKRLTPEQQREHLRRQSRGHERVAELRKAALRGKPYSFEEVDAVLSLADDYDGPPRTTSGLIEQQRRFMMLPHHPCNRAKKDPTSES